MEYVKQAIRPSKNSLSVNYSDLMLYRNGIASKVVVCTCSSVFNVGVGDMFYRGKFNLGAGACLIRTKSIMFLLQKVVIMTSMCTAIIT